MCVSSGMSARPTPRHLREFQQARREIGLCFYSAELFVAELTSIGDCHGIANSDDSNCQERLSLQHGAQSGRQILRQDSSPLSAPCLEFGRVFSSQLL